MLSLSRDYWRSRHSRQQKQNLCGIPRERASTTWSVAFWTPSVTLLVGMNLPCRLVASIESLSSFFNDWQLRSFWTLLRKEFKVKCTSHAFNLARFGLLLIGLLVGWGITTRACKWQDHNRDNMVHATPLDRTAQHHFIYACYSFPRV